MKLRLLFLFCLVAPVALAHELEENRATLVLRDDTHVSLTVFVNYVEALHQALAPARPFPEFLVVYSAMKPEEFQRELQRAQTRFRTGIHLVGPSGAEIPLSNWTWPESARVQDMLRYRSMQAIVDPAAHSHDTPLEIHADANSPQAVSTLRIQFPEEFQKVLVVSYRPNQVWAERKTLSPVIRF